MAFKKVNIGGIENLLELEQQKPVEGVFEGFEDYIAKDEEHYTLGKIIIGTVKHRFFCSGQLAFLLKTVTVGDKVRITYLGLTEKVIKTKKGGEKQIHQYRVEVDDGK